MKLLWQFQISLKLWKLVFNNDLFATTDDNRNSMRNRESMQLLYHRLINLSPITTAKELQFPTVSSKQI